MILLLIVPPVLICGIALLLLWLPLPMALSKNRNLIAAVVTGLLGMGYLIAVLVGAVAAVRHADPRLDEVCTAYGLAARGYALGGRQCEGELQERAVTLRLQPGQGARRAVLDIFVAAQPLVRMAWGMRKPLLGCEGCARVIVDGWEDSALQVYAEDPVWANDWLVDETVRTVAARVVDEPERLGYREIALQPERVWLRGHPSDMVDAQVIEGWLEDALLLADLVEKVNTDH
ncbi:MAG: hypothetical protein JXR84_01695 [Anaerolineae bacterium]|nr:hypothetical protein [Anaerolineae bacterium]